MIGHEITHGFDDSGRQYDAAGALNDWWTEQDAQRFNASAEKLIAQYSAYCPFKGLCVNGKLTSGENIADLRGLAVAYDAYQLSLEGKAAPVIANRTGNQRFFEGLRKFGAARCVKTRQKIASPQTHTRQILTARKPCVILHRGMKPISRHPTKKWCCRKRSIHALFQAIMAEKAHEYCAYVLYFCIIT